jgi:hypothetical protein
LSSDFNACGSLFVKELGAFNFACSIWSLGPNLLFDFVKVNAFHDWATPRMDENFPMYFCWLRWLTQLLTFVVEYALSAVAINYPKGILQPYSEAVSFQTASSRYLCFAIWRRVFAWTFPPIVVWDFRKHDFDA